MNDTVPQALDHSATVTENTGHYLQESQDAEAYYDKLYTALRRDPLIDHKAEIVYATLRGVSRKSGRCEVLNDNLAKMCGISTASIGRAIQTLRDRGLIICHVSHKGGGTQRHIFFPPLSSIYPPKSTNVPHDQIDEPGTQIEQPGDQFDHHTIRTNDTGITKENNGAHAPAGAASVSLSDRERDRDRGGSQATTKPVSNNSGTYWTERRERQFKAMWEVYPKQYGEAHARSMWPRVIGASFDEDKEDREQRLEELWNGIHRWKAYWKKEQIEIKFIPTFTTFLERGMWRDTPQSGRVK